MNLFEGEKILTTTDNNIIIPTTHRIRSTNSLNWGHRETTSIMLDKISSIKATYNSYPLLLIIGIIVGLGGLFPIAKRYFTYGSTFAIVLGVILISAYFATRRHVCVIASSGGARIVFETANMGRDGLLSFIDRVEEAKYRSMLRVVI